MNTRNTWPEWVRPAAILAAVAALVVFALREALFAPAGRLPGTDSGIYYVWEISTRAALGTGQLPHWNPFQYSGMPHLADPQMKVLYPPAMLLRWLSPDRFFAWLTALHLLVAGAGALFLGRVLGLGWLVSAIAATAVALGGSVGGWLNAGHLLIVNCVAWLPWALGASVLTVRRASVLPHAVLPLVMVLQVLAGYPQGALYISTAVALYFLYSAAWPERASGVRRRVVTLAQFAVAAALSLGLAAFQVLPAAQLAAEAARTTGLSYEDATLGAWTLRDLATFVRPEPGVPDRVAYVGLLLTCAALLAFFDRARRRTVVFLAILTMLAIGVAFGGALPLYALQHAVFPGFRIPTRALFVATLGMAMLGAIGLAFLVEASTRVLRARAWSHATLTAAWIVVAVEVTPFAAAGVETIPRDGPDTMRRWAGGPDGGRAITLCEHKVSRFALSLAGIPSVAGPLGVNLRGYVEWLNVVDSGDRPSDVLGRFPIRRDLLDASNVTKVIACEPVDAPRLTLLSRTDPVRVYRNEAAWPRAIWTCETAPVSRNDARRALLVGRYVEPGRLLREAIVTIRWVPGVSDEARAGLESRYALAEGTPREGSTWRYVLRDVNAANVAALVRDPHVEDTHGIDRGTTAIAAGDGDQAAPAPSGGSDIVVGLARCHERGEVEVVVRDRPDGHVVANVKAPRDGLVFFSEPFYPERAAFVDGRPVKALSANIAFTAVPVPAGEHRVELRLIPRTFRAGLAMSLATLGIWGAIAVAMRRRERGGAPPRTGAALGAPEAR